jgi:antirestriction protein ArdC
MNTKSKSFDIAQHITDQIVKAIEAGAGKWEMPWHAVGSAMVAPINVTSGKPYRGMNTWLLMAASQEFGFSSNVWGTYKAWGAKGAQVKKGEKSTMVIFWKRSDYKVTNEAGEKEDKKGLLLRYYNVFNASQVEGYEPKVVPVLSTEQRIENAELFFDGLNIVVKHGGNRAYYIPSQDYIQMPEFSQFKQAEGYYATMGHEMIHSTGHESRNNRLLNTTRFGDEAYAFEELVAELGSAFLCAHLGIANDPRPDHAQYIQGWLKALKNDKRAVFTAASKAQAALDYLTKQEEEVEVEEAA